MKTLMEAHGKESPCYITVKKWAAEFRRRRESIEDDERTGRPKRVPVMHSLAMCDRRRNLRDIASEVGISFGAVQSVSPNRHLRNIQGLGYML